MKDGLIDLILYLTAAIDCEQNSSITLDSLEVALKDRSVFNYLKTNIKSTRSFDEKVFSKTERVHLELHWRSMFFELGTIHKLGIKDGPISLMIAAAAISIQ